MFFNDFINNRRKELNISIDELVEKSGVPKGTLSKITAGISTNPTLSTVEALCSALNCSLDDAVGYIEKNKNGITFSKSEIDTIKKYRSLDQFGKKAVDDLLDNQYERCQFEAKEEPKFVPTLVAARSKNNDEPINVTQTPRDELKIFDTVPQSDEEL